MTETTQPREQASERELFEAWMKARPGYPFAGAFANLMWEAWQARASRQAAAEAPDRDVTVIDYGDPTLACSSCGLTMGESRTLGHIKLGILATPAATSASVPFIITGILGSSNSTEPVRIFRGATTASASELEQCGVCGSGQLYCNGCGTGFASIRRSTAPSRNADWQSGYKTGYETGLSDGRAEFTNPAATSPAERAAMSAATEQKEQK